MRYGKIPSRLNLGERVAKHWQLYLLLIPALAYVLIFNYAPMYGIVIAFKNFKPHLGYLGSPNAGLEHFSRFINSTSFMRVVPNTLILSLYQLVFGFPVPILLAISLTYITSVRYKKLVQNVTYAPYFLSIVVVVGMMQILLSPDYGVINKTLGFLGVEPKFFMGQPQYFRGVYVASGVWQMAGWDSIIYLSALANVSGDLHEAAIIDGANIPKRVWYIDIPSIAPTIITLLILNTGYLMNMGFDKAFLMQTDMNIVTSEIIPTYVYKIGLLDQRYSYSTAINLFNSLINVILMVVVNALSRKVSDTSLF